MGEQSRAALPVSEGYVERDGVAVHFEVYAGREVDAAAPAILLLPPWSIVSSRCWKLQVPYLSRHFRVLTFDPRGNGRSDRPTDPAAYAETEFAADALAVLEATDTSAAYVVGHSMGAQRGLILAAEEPERVRGLVLIGPALPLGRPTTRSADLDWFEVARDSYQGWQKYNRHYWEADYEGFLEFFFDQVAPEPHSTKLLEDLIGWGRDVAPEVLIASARGQELDETSVRDVAARVRCPVLVVHGSDDRVRSPTAGRAIAELTGGRYVELAGSGHSPHGRVPVVVNRLIREFVVADSNPEPRPPTRPRRSRDKRVLYLSSPIGLGHARRDVAIADELRRLRPGLQVDWLAEDPVTRVLETRGERIHPASRFLANESAHLCSEASEHDLHAFQAVRRMDEILLANFMVFDDLVREEGYHLWVGDEAWDLDYFLHENPGLKTTPYAWFTDFVGWLPMPEGGGPEAELAADYNAQMIEHIARHPGLRDRSIFVGNPDDIVPADFGPNLPSIRDWTREHYAFAGYVTGFDAAALADREALRAELGYSPEEVVCLVTVGGSGVGESLLRRTVEAAGPARELVPGLRMIVVAGPRIAPESLPSADGVEVVGYLPDLFRHLAACDIAVVQGGLTTCMELAATGRPFLYFPLRGHFEQNFHVPHRLSRYGAGRRMDYADSGPTEIARAIAAELGRPITYRPVETDGAARAAALIADLL